MASLYILWGYGVAKSSLGDWDGWEKVPEADEAP